MTTLTSTSLVSLLDRLFEEDETSSVAMDSLAADVSKEERVRLMQSKTEYLDFYTRLKDAPLAVSRETASLLYMLARSCRAKSIVEFGTSIGISTLHLAAALQDNGGGRLITSEFEPGKLARAKANLTAAGLVNLVEFREGDAMKILSVNRPESIDLLLLDGAKSLYLDILALLEDHFKPGTLIIADNADYCPEYLERVRSVGSGYMSIPFAEDVELSMWLGK